MNKKKIKKFLLVFTALTLFITEISFPQSFPFKHHKHYSLEEGLASSFVTCIFQDSSGYFWFGTQHGISRFNGIDFQNFYVKDGLVNDYIQDIWEDQKGNLWVGTLGGLICMNSRDWKTYTTDHGLSNNHINSVIGDLEGNIWIGTNSGLNKFDGKRFTIYTKENGLIDNSIVDIAIDKKGNLWLATSSGLSCFTNHGFINYTTDNGLIDNNVKALMMDHKGNTWIGTQAGISCYHHGKGIFTSYTTKTGLPDNSINSIIEDKNENIWIGTSGGLSLFSSGTFTNFYVKSGLLEDNIYTVFEGKEGNIWLGTSIGVSCLHSLRFLNFSVQDGLPNNLIWAILEEKKGKYWIGTNKGLSCYSQEKFTNYTTKEGLLNDSVYDLLQDRNGNIWVATGGGISVYRGGKFTNYTEDDGLPYHIVLSLEEGRDDVIWIGTTKGLCRFMEGKITSPPFQQTPSPIHAILQDSRGNLWFSDFNVLYKISGNKSTVYSTENGLIHNKIYSLFEDSRGRIWIATQQGLSCLDNEIFTNYTTARGLSDDACFFILEDRSQNLWIGTGKGIDRFDGNSFKNYTSRDGLASSEMSKNACLKDSQGYLWFGTNNGLSRYNPSLDRLNTVRPPVYITGFNVLGVDYSTSRDIKLEYNQNHLQISFIGLSFTSPEDVTYRYRLEGIDRYWSETTNRSISYSSLNPGEYTFRVIARNNDGFESPNPAEIRFFIQPPFYRTWWFRLILILFALFVAAMVLLWYVKWEKEKIASQARNKQLMMAQRMELMGVLAGGAVHDLKNLLSIIIGYTKMAVEFEEEMDEEEKDEALGIIKDTATTAIQLVQQILAFARQRYDHTTAVNLTELIDEVLEILKVTLSPGIEVLWAPPKDDVWLYINPIQFKQVVLNLCINAVQAMQEQEQKGKLKISLGKDSEEQIILEISDTGPGIPQEMQDKIFDPLFTTKAPGKGTGLGLFVVKQITTETKAKIQVQSQVGKGTTFKISFPPLKEPEETSLSLPENPG